MFNFTPIFLLDRKQSVSNIYWLLTRCCVQWSRLYAEVLKNWAMYPSGLDKSPWFSNKGKSPFAVSANPDEITER